MGSNPSHFKGDERPVETVSWDECRTFCRQLGQKTGHEFRLPTEAEWELACRSGTTTTYYTGDGLEGMRRAGWCIYARGQRAAKKTKPVGQFQPNGWGLFDLHGNVSEWCLDRLGVYTP
jgi:formylglycine-generating enzyme required for sulfatase activity